MFLLRTEIAVLCVVMLSGSAKSIAAETAYLKPGDVIVCVGDSVTAAGVYDGFLQTMFDRLYPGAGIRVVNRGQGGQSANAAAGLLDSALKTERPTLATFMFGVNDTRWSTGDEDAKAAAFVTGLTAAVNLAEKKQVVPLLLRESHFSHGQAPDEFAMRINEVFDRLMAAQNAFAATRQVPVIDTLGAYKRSLAAAWTADPRYEFSPDIVHPNSAGHAAMTGELLRALGAGLPLAERTGTRGPLRLAAPADLTIEIATAAGVAKTSGTLKVPVTIHNRSAERQAGALMLCIADHLFDTPVAVVARASTTVTCELPLASLKADRSVGPLYVAFRGEQRFATASTLLFHSRIRPAMAASVVFSDDDFQSAANKDGRACPVTQVAMRRNGSELTVDFTWTDTTIVTAQPSFKNRFGQNITTPLDLNSRDGQPCDAVEMFLDQRPVNTIGRPTANADANPEGVLRIGLCFMRADGKQVVRVISSPKLPTEALTLAPKGPDAWSLIVKCAPAGPCLGVSMRVTDNTEFKFAATPQFWLTGHRGTGQEPMGYIQLGEQDAGILYRIGY